MASLSIDRNGGRRIQFVAGDGERRAVRLGRVPVKVAEVVLRRVEQLVADRIAGTAHDADLSSWLAAVPTKLYSRLARVGLVAPRADAEAVTLDRLCAAFKERSSVKAITAASYRQTTDSLLAFFGPEKSIERINREGADEWRKAIGTATKHEGERQKKRVSPDGRLAPATVAKRVHVAKQIFGKAVAWGWLKENPFKGLRAGSQANPARAFYVDTATTEAVLEACPGVQWRLVFALSRLAGLRCPSEVGGLTWADVDWKGGRLTVRSPKTEHHGGGHAVRLVPIVPRLREILADAFEVAADGEVLVVPMAADKRKNLRTTLEKIIARANVQPWPRLLQNLRASCETDWVQKYPAHVCAKWMGHSPTVAAMHYLQVRDHHFQDAIDGGLAGEKKSGAFSGAPSAQKQAQQGSARVRHEPQAASETVESPEGNAISPAAVAILENQPVGDIGLEHPTFPPGKIEVRVLGGAESGAVQADRRPDPVLDLVAARWPSLTAEQRLAIVAIITTAEPAICHG